MHLCACPIVNDPGDHICLFSRSSPINPRDHISLLPRGLSPPRPQLPTCRHAISCDILQHRPSIPYCCPRRQHLQYRQHQYRQHQYRQHQYRQHQYRPHQHIIIIVSIISTTQPYCPYRQHQPIIINIVSVTALASPARPTSTRPNSSKNTSSSSETDQQL